MRSGRDRLRYTDNNRVSKRKREVLTEREKERERCLDWSLYRPHTA